MKLLVQIAVAVAAMAAIALSQPTSNPRSAAAKPAKQAGPNWRP
jgi:hypothetical protein